MCLPVRGLNTLRRNLKMTNEEKYEDLVKIAENSVRNISDPSLKVEAFKTILEDLLKSKRSIDNPASKESTPKEREEVQVRQSNPLTASVQNNVYISSEELGLVYRIDGTEFELVCNFDSNNKWQQIQYVFLTLYGNYLTKGERKMSSFEIIRRMKEHGFGELPNINSFLRELEPKFIYVKTLKEKSRNSFELTINGIKASEKLISAIIANSGDTFGRVDEVFGIEQKKRKKRGANVQLKSPLAKQIFILIKEGFFNNPTPIKSLGDRLEERGHFYSRDVVDEKVRRVFLGKELRRIKKDKKWHYIRNGD